MNQIYEKLVKCYEYCRDKVNFIPKVALVLGSGLGNYARNVKVVAEIPYSEIEGFPVSTVAGHDGRFLFGYIEEVPVVLMKGRVHYYEGYSMQDVVLPIRLMKMLGAKILFLTNASGGIKKGFSAGDFMLITAQIASFVPSPLIGKNLDELGPRFPDMSEVYNKDLQEIIRETAKEEQIPLQEGVYLQFTGPNYESPAEVRLAGILGADAVGMSTACEAIAANHMGMKICGISCISNLACGISEAPLNHEEVQKTADEKAPLFERLVTKSIVKMCKKTPDDTQLVSEDKNSLIEEKQSLTEEVSETMKRQQVKIYTDGAARGNPDGPGGYGTVLEFVDTKGELHTKEFSCGYKKTTNNRMELMAAIVGLEALNKPCDVELYSDSKYLVDAFNQHWIDSWLKKGWKRGKNEPVKNIDLWKRLLKAKEQHRVTFIWVKGHDGHAQNERCDELATTAADGDNLLDDVVLESAIKNKNFSQ